jgi:D-alanyl-D-alanine dipeptidase
MPRGRETWDRSARRGALAVALALALAALATPGAQPQAPGQADVATAALEKTTGLPEPLVYLRDIDPSIIQDMRYAGIDNFTGRRVPGYGAPECVLLREAAEALSRVQQALAPRKLSLKVYDCYRPRRAVRSFVEWVKAETGVSDPLLKRFHPRIERGQLISLGYVSAMSRHSRGDTVDLTLVELPAKPAPPFRRDATYGACTGPVERRSPDASVDMGTGFDCFDPLSHTKAEGISPAQRRWRTILVEAMAEQGFHNYFREWWHFTLARPHPGRLFNVPITPRK